jgi:hypothetical protein
MKVYKLTDAKGQTKNAMPWGENITHARNTPGGYHRQHGRPASLNVAGCDLLITYA